MPTASPTTSADIPNAHGSIEKKIHPNHIGSGESLYTEKKPRAFTKWQLFQSLPNQATL